jgi:hypothetical protein
MVRCCYENFFWIGGLTGKGEMFVEQIIKAHAEGQLKTGNALLEWAKKQETPVDFEGSLSALLDPLKAEKPKGAVDYKGAADAANIGDAYIIYRVLSTDAAHPSVTSLGRHLHYNESVKPPVLTFDGTPKIDKGEEDQTVEFGFSTLLGVCVGANQIAGPTSAGKELGALFDAFTALSKKK